jgi:hypothetical protein
MKKNMGNVDRILRVLVSVVLVALYFGGIIEGTLGIVLIAAAAIFTLTSLVSFCPIYTLIGVSTCPTKK